MENDSTPLLSEYLVDFNKRHCQDFALTDNGMGRDLGKRPLWWPDSRSCSPIWPMSIEPLTLQASGPCLSLSGPRLGRNPICRERFLSLLTIHILWGERTRGKWLCFLRLVWASYCPPVICVEDQQVSIEP